MYSTDKHSIFYIIYMFIYWGGCSCWLPFAAWCTHNPRNKKNKSEQDTCWNNSTSLLYHYRSSLYGWFLYIDRISSIGKSGPILPNRNSTQGVPCSTAPRRSHPSAITWLGFRQTRREECHLLTWQVHAIMRQSTNLHLKRRTVFLRSCLYFPFVWFLCGWICQGKSFTEAAAACWTTAAFNTGRTKTFAGVESIAGKWMIMVDR